MSLRVVFMGTPEFAVPSLKTIHEHFDLVAVVSQQDKKRGRGQKLLPTAVKKTAQQLGISVYCPENLSTDEVKQFFKEINPDIIVVAAYGKMIPQWLLDLPRLGCVNIHSSLLPRWRGAAPIHWAILSGDQQTGVTIMKMVPKLDAGDIVLKQSTRISPEDTIQTLHDRLAQIGAELIIEALKRLEQGTVQAQPQEDSLVTYASKLTKTMEKAQFQELPEVVERQVRALGLWPGVSVVIENQGKLKLKQVKICRDRTFPPGQIQTEDQRLFLGCRDGSVELVKVQWEGKKPVSGSDFVNQCRGSGISFPLFCLS